MWFPDFRGLLFEQFRNRGALRAQSPRKSVSRGPLKGRYARSIERLESRVVLAPDFGDAPLPYSTTLTENGARHVDVGPTLGATRDSEVDGSHSSGADSDGADEDGVTFGSIQAGALGATVIVNVQNAVDDALLNAWIDFNGDGNWGGEGEQIARNVAVVNGDNSISFDVPISALSGATFARFRLSTVGDLGPAGSAPDGEVEDYQVVVTPPTPSGGLFESTQIISDSLIAASLAIPADVDGDGDMDIIATGNIGFQVSWFENDGHQNFAEHSISTLTVQAVSLSAVDLDGDQDLDILFTEPSGFDGSFRKVVGWFENDGDQNFAPHTIFIDPQGGFAAPSPVDMDGDGDLDILIPTTFANVMSWLENDGSSNFTPHIMGPIGDPSNLSINAVAAADIDGDGDLDAIAAQAGNDDSISWYENDGHQNFVVHPIDSTVNLPLSIVATDLDGDGDQDILTGDRGYKDILTGDSADDAIYWYENKGAGQFTRHVLSKDLGMYYGLATADFDGDGDPDVLATISTPENNKIIGWFDNHGAGSFEFHTVATRVPQSGFGFAGDIDSDGDLDVVATAYYENQVAWFENLNAVDLSVSTTAGSEAGTTIVNVTATTPLPLTVDTSVTVVVSGTNITAGDYSLSSSVITIPAGQLSGSVTFTIQNDAQVEGTEVATLTLVNPSSGLTLGNTITQQIAIEDDDKPTFSSGATATVPENTPVSTVILDVNLNPTPVAGLPISFALTGADQDLFQIDAITGAITFKASPDFELPADQDRDNVYHITVTATAAAIPAASSSQDLTITVTPVNDNDPVFTSASTASFAENTPTSTPVLDATATDLDQPDQMLTYGLTGPDAELFQINPVTGEMTFVTSPNFEAPADNGHDNSYHVTIMATDNQSSARSSMQDVTITVTPINDNPPVFTSAATALVIDNTPISAVILDADAIDADLPTQPLTYRLTGPDADLFHINDATGEITFVSTPQVNSPADQGADNVYNITVVATDDGVPALSTGQDLTIKVVPANGFDPVFVDASPTFLLAENSAAGTVVGGVSATDLDLPLQTVTYSIVSGDESGAFAIDPVTGQITVTNSMPLNFETNATFSLGIRATDSGYPSRTADALVVVNLTDVVEAPQIVIPIPTGTYQLGKSPGLISPTSSFTYGDAGHPNYNGAIITVSIAAGRSKKDKLGITTKGHGAGEINVKGHKILSGNTVIGIFAGGKGKKGDLTVALNGQATTTAVDRLLRQLNFQAKDGAGVTRSVTMQITQIDGADSNVALRQLAVAQK